MAGIDDIAAERKRQVEAEGWSASHDDKHTDKSLALVAALYATPVPLFEKTDLELGGITFSDPWPWWAKDHDPQGRGGPVRNWDKRTIHDERKRLVIAGALLAAEIDRIDRYLKKVAAEFRFRPATSKNIR